MIFFGPQLNPERTNLVQTDTPSKNIMNFRYFSEPIAWVPQNGPIGSTLKTDNIGTTGCALLTKKGSTFNSLAGELNRNLFTVSPLPWVWAVWKRTQYYSSLMHSLTPDNIHSSSHMIPMASRDHSLYLSLLAPKKYPVKGTCEDYLSLIFYETPEIVKNYEHQNISYVQPQCHI